MSRKNNRFVLFDLDGTVADTAPDLGDTINQVLNEENREAVDLELIRPYISQGGVGMLKFAFQLEDDASELERLRTRFLDIYASRLDNKTTLFDGIAELLDSLEAQHISWGIVTNKSERFTYPVLKHLKLLDKTPCVVAGDTIEFSKPHPAPMLHACKLLDCRPEETVFIGDAKKDVEAGNSAGMTTLIAAYGYIEKQTDINEWDADGIINDPNTVMDWVAGC